MIDKIPRRTKKAVLHHIDRLIKKYGYEEVRCLVNRMFLEKRETKKLEEQVKEKQAELEKLRSKIRK